MKVAEAAGWCGIPTYSKPFLVPRPLFDPMELLSIRIRWPFSLGAWQSGTAKDDDGSAKEEETTMDGEG